MCTEEPPQPQELNSLEYTGKGGAASVLSKSCLGKPAVIPGSVCRRAPCASEGCVLEVCTQLFTARVLSVRLMPALDMCLF